MTLFQRLSDAVGQENVFASPFSVSVAMSMLLIGARNQTEEQIIAGLRLNSLDKNRKNVHQMFQEVRFAVVRFV